MYKNVIDNGYAEIFYKKNEKFRFFPWITYIYIYIHIYIYIIYITSNIKYIIHICAFYFLNKSYLRERDLVQSTGVFCWIYLLGKISQNFGFRNDID